jgi:hypothetical protein
VEEQPAGISLLLAATSMLLAVCWPRQATLYRMQAVAQRAESVCLPGPANQSASTT